MERNSIKLMNVKIPILMKFFNIYTFQNYLQFSR